MIWHTRAALQPEWRVALGLPSRVEASPRPALRLRQSITAARPRPRLPSFTVARLRSRLPSLMAAWPRPRLPSFTVARLRSRLPSLMAARPRPRLSSFTAARPRPRLPSFTAVRPRSRPPSSLTAVQLIAKEQRNEQQFRLSSAVPASTSTAPSSPSSSPSRPSRPRSKAAPRVRFSSEVAEPTVSRSRSGRTIRPPTRD